MIEEDIADVYGQGDAEGVEHLSDEELLVVEAEGVPELDKGVRNLVHALI